MKHIAKHYNFAYGCKQEAIKLKEALEVIEIYSDDREFKEKHLDDRGQAILKLSNNFEANTLIQTSWLVTNLEEEVVEALIEEGDLEPDLDNWEEVLNEIERDGGLDNFIGKGNIHMVEAAHDAVSSWVGAEFTKDELAAMVAFLGSLVEVMVANEQMKNNTKSVSKILDITITR